MQGHEKKITGAASVVGSATVASRVLGYARDASIAYVFGAGLYADAFFVAFRIANLLRRLVGEGALTSSFIPIFTEELHARPREAVARFASAAFTLFALILAVLTVLGMLFSSELVTLMSPGFIGDPAKFELTARLTMMMFPYMVFIGLMAIAMGVLNSLKHFAAPAVSPVFFNLALIAAVFALAPFMDQPVYALAVGVIVGGFLQFAVQLPALKSRGFMPRVNFGFSDPALKRVFVLMGPAALGVGVYQLNIFVTQWFASSLEVGAISYLYYSGRLMELPIGIFGVAVSTAALPALADHAARKEWAEFKGSVSFALRMINFVTIPATVGLVVLSLPITDTLFTRGRFDSAAAVGTATALLYYAVGLVPVSVSRVLASVLYSIKDTMTPLLAALASFVANAVLCVVLVGPLLSGGLALATSLAAVLNAVLLFIILRKRLGRFDGRRILKAAIKNSVAAGLMGLAIYASTLFIDFALLGTAMKAVYVAAALGGGVGLYLLISKLLKVEELASFAAIIRKGR